MSNDIIYVKETRYKNVCKACGKEIPKGFSCYWEKGTKNNWHTDHKPSASSELGRAEVEASAGRLKPLTPVGASPSAIGTTIKINQANTEAAINNRFDFAEKMVHDRYPNLEGQDAYYFMIIEVMAQQRSLQWMEAEKQRGR